MRIVGGICKGRRLASFKGLSIRPTSDKVREAVFNILASKLHFDGLVLDLFAGTGAMGIEALSRGAKEAVFIDNSAPSVSVIRKNIETCGLEDRARVIKKDAIGAVEVLSRTYGRFELIFIDPPYDALLLPEVLKAVDAGGLLSPGGVLVAEASKRAPLAVETKNLCLIDERRYGDTLVYFYCIGDAKEQR